LEQREVETELRVMKVGETAALGAFEKN
jgi:hypothetical protein